MAEPDDEMEEHRYSHLMNATQQREFRETFVLFDYDGGGDVDLRELGMMLRKLGQAPSDAELAQMINDFDYDKSGTIDIEEFCGMMLASVRAAAVPKWLVARCDPPEREDQLELRYEPGESGGLRRPLSLDQQLFVIDMQRRNTHLTALSLHGNGLGSFAASELAHVLTHVNLTLRQLDLSRNLLADAGAAHVATMLRSNDQLTALDLSSNAIGVEGGGALLLALEAGRHALVACDLRGNQLPEARMCTACAPHVHHITCAPRVHRVCTSYLRAPRARRCCARRPPAASRSRCLRCCVRPPGPMAPSPSPSCHSSPPTPRSSAATCAPRCRRRRVSSYAAPRR